MSILLKNRDSLTQLFETFNLHEAMLVNENLKASLYLLASSPDQVLLAMADVEVSIEEFLGEKCLPLIRFYISDEKQQKDLFFSKDLLEELFISLPTVEAIVFKDQINRALVATQDKNNGVSSRLLEEKFDIIDPVLQMNGFRSNNKEHTKQLLNELAELDKPYLNCFYYLFTSGVSITPEGESFNIEMLLYSELSPKQQLAAQKLFKLNDDAQNTDRISDQSVSA